MSRSDSEAPRQEGNDALSYTFTSHKIGPRWWQLRYRWSDWRYRRAVKRYRATLDPDTLASLDAIEREMSRLLIFGDEPR